MAGTEINPVPTDDEAAALLVEPLRAGVVAHERLGELDRLGVVKIDAADDVDCGLQEFRGGCDEASVRLDFVVVFGGHEHFR